MSSVSFYKWRAKCGGMEASDMNQLNELVEENHRLKKMYADSQMDNEILREAMIKSGEVIVMEADSSLGSEK